MMADSENSDFCNCTLCGKPFESVNEYMSHVKTTHSPNKLQCKLCGDQVLKEEYSDHVSNVHGFDLKGEPAVEEDDEGSTDEDEENEDEMGGDDMGGDDMGEESMMTGKEEDSMVSSDLCKVEMNDSTGDGPKILEYSFKGIECCYCHQTYSSELNLKKHVYNVHRMQRVKCNVCDKEVNKKSLDRHMKSVHCAKVDDKKERKVVAEEDKVPCYLCPKRCASLMSLQAHIKTIHEAEQFKCPQCDFSSIKKILDKHIKKEHNQEIFQCQRCQKVLKSKSTLKEHMWIHTDHRRFICDICGMRFKRTSNYHGHMKSHQEKKFQCQLCGNFFLRKRYLAVHEQTIHDFYGKGVPPQEKGYQCEVCGVKLKWKNNLMAHMRIHTGEKPYKCKICNDDFTCHGSLRTHMSKHAVCSVPPEDSNTLIQNAYLDGRGSHLVPGTVPFDSP